MKLNHDRVIMVANWQYCLAGKEIHMRVTEKLVKNPGVDSFHKKAEKEHPKEQPRKKRGTDLQR